MSWMTGGIEQRFSCFIARQAGGEIEAKAIDVHLFHPVTQGIEDETGNNRLIGIEGVSCT